MDAHVKAGHVYLQPRKVGKKWKQVWLSLYPHSLCSIGRLEISDFQSSWAGAGGGEWSSTVDSKRHQQAHKERKLKVVRLSMIISVRKLPPHAEALPKDNMAAFCVKTDERTLVFAALKEETVEWVEKVCQMAFQNQSVCGGSSKPQMEENQIYGSTQEVGLFSVAVRQSDAAERCGLQGAYRLQVGPDGLSLSESDLPGTIWTWPYRLLRRYGKDNLALTIEAGRRCESGPGTFTFETGQASILFGLIEDAIKHQQSSPAVTIDPPAIHTASQNPDGVAPLPSRRPRSPLPKIPDMNCIPSMFQNCLNLESTPLVDRDERGSSAQPSERMSAPECLYAQPRDRNIPTSSSAPVSCVTLPAEPHVHTTDGTGSSGSSPSKGAACVYADPARFLPLKPPVTSNAMTAPGPSLPTSLPPSTRHGDDPEPIYSEVYDHLGPGQRGVQPVPRQRGGTDNDPIYAQPVGKAERDATKNDDKRDQFAHLYAHVSKLTPPLDKTPPFSTLGAAGPAAMKPSEESDVIYETLGVI